MLCYSPLERPGGTLRTLGDLDVLVDPDLRNLEKISQALVSLRIHLSPAQLQEAFTAKKLPNLVMYRAQLFPEITGVQTPDVLAQAQTAESSIGPVPIISKALLIVAKKAAARPKDLEDVQALELA